jgi:predicted dithiol-disulfide oxidoreductase (DUF899 family)
MTKSPENDQEGGQLAMRTPPIVSPQEWDAARQQLLVKEKAQMRAHDALAAERRRMPWMAVEQAYAFEGPTGTASLLDLFDGRRQLIIYRAFFEPGVFGWPEHACRGCSLGADQVAHLAHLNARDTTLAYASRAPQADIARLKARMGWEIPWYTEPGCYRLGRNVLRHRGQIENPIGPEPGAMVKTIVVEPRSFRSF